MSPRLERVNGVRSFSSEGGEQVWQAVAIGIPPSILNNSKGSRDKE